ncbi:PIPO, partial [Clover yellow vein virus]|uniref:PIPO n=1 Tax=Clover yellow vein virus TaxID=12198 RepID=UPI00026512F9
NLGRGFRAAMARFKIVTKVLFNKAVMEAAGKVFQNTSPERRARCQRQVQRITQIVSNKH